MRMRRPSWEDWSRNTNPANMRCPVESASIEEIISGFSGMRMPYRSDSMAISWSFMITVPRVENVPVLISLPKLAKSSSYLSNVHEENAGMSTISVKATYK